MAQPFFIHMALSMAVKHLICINYDLNFLNRWHCATVKINVHCSKNGSQNPVHRLTDKKTDDGKARWLNNTMSFYIFFEISFFRNFDIFFILFR